MVASQRCDVPDKDSQKALHSKMKEDGHGVNLENATQRGRGLGNGLVVAQRPVRAGRVEPLQRTQHVSKCNAHERRRLLGRLPQHRGGQLQRGGAQNVPES